MTDRRDRGPLFDTLFRPTTTDPAGVPHTVAAPPEPVGSPGLTSAAPVRAAGVHSRAGNAMSRTRSALLAGAARAVAQSGTRIAMSQVATAAGVAKATLYNHFRTRDAVLAAVVLDQVQQLIDAAADLPLEAALVMTAETLSGSVVLRGLATVEPAVLAGLGRIDETAPGWVLAREAVAAALADTSRTGTDTVLRWLASYLISPGEHADFAAGAAVLVAGLPVVETGAADERRDTLGHRSA